MCAASALASDQIVSEVTISEYVFTIRTTNYGMTHDLLVTRRDKPVWSLSEYFVKLLDRDSLGLPRDLNDDQIPDVIIETFSGGAHCCFVQYVVSLGNRFEVLDTIDHAGLWSDRDGDRLWEVTASDLTLDYWKLPHSDSPIPFVILEATDSGFVPNVELMRKPAPTATEVLAVLRDARSRDWRDYNKLSETMFMSPAQAVLHRHLVELIYSGNAKTGLEVLETGWPLFILGREQYTLDLLEKLRTSPYWEVLAEMNAGTVFSN